MRFTLQIEMKSKKEDREAALAECNMRLKKVKANAVRTDGWRLLGLMTSKAGE